MREAQERFNFQVRGVLTLRSAAHQTAPGPKGAGKPTPQIKMQLAGSPLQLPIITANSVRGLLRRAAGGILLEQTAKAGQISRNNYLNILRGSPARTGADGGGASYQQLAAASAHVFTGLFGGGPFMYHSRLRMESDLIPLIPETGPLVPTEFHDRQLNPRKMNDSTEGQVVKTMRDEYNLLGTMLLTARDDMERLPDTDVMADAEDAYFEHMETKNKDNTAKRQQKDRMDAEMAKLEARHKAGMPEADFQAARREINSEEKLTTADVRIFTLFEIINPGTPLYFGLSLTGVTKAQAGMAFLAIQAWANANALGGGKARGRGSFAAALKLYKDGEVFAEHFLEGDSPAYRLSDLTKPFTDELRAQIEAHAAPQVILSMYPTDVVQSADGAPEGVAGKAKPGRRPKAAAATATEA